MPRPSAGQVWPRVLAATAGTPLFPQDPTTMGAPHVDDEEWNGTASAWTVDVAPTAPNAVVINGAMTPSRLVFQARNTTGDSFQYTKPLTLATGDVSVFFDVAGVFNGDFKAIECGFRQKTGTSDDAMMALIHHTTVGGTNGLYLLMRKHTNYQGGTFTDVANVLLANTTPTKLNPVHLYLNLQRVSGVWSLWYSIDAAAWSRVGTSSDAFTMTHLQFAMGGFGATAPYSFSNDFLRINRLFLSA